MIKKLIILSSVLVMTSCVTTLNRSGAGLIMTQTRDVMFVDNNVKPLKKGEACSHRVLAIVAFGDASMEAAKDNARISKIAIADTDYFNILGIYGKACTVVKGE